MKGAFHKRLPMTEAEKKRFKSAVASGISIDSLVTRFGMSKESVIILKRTLTKEKQNEAS